MMAESPDVEHFCLVDLLLSFPTPSPPLSLTATPHFRLNNMPSLIPSPQSYMSCSRVTWAPPESGSGTGHPDAPGAGKCHVNGSRGPRRNRVQERALQTLLQPPKYHVHDLCACCRPGLSHVGPAGIGFRNRPSKAPGAGKMSCSRLMRLLPATDQTCPRLSPEYTFVCRPHGGYVYGPAAASCTLDLTVQRGTSLSVYPIQRE
jgi:hypothetical protein